MTENNGLLDDYLNLFLYFGSCHPTFTDLGPVCQEFGAWLHVDASYAGNAFICPEYQYLMKGIEVGFTLSINYVFINNLPSISSMINVRVFCTKFWRQKSQSRT